MSFRKVGIVAFLVGTLLLAGIVGMAFAAQMDTVTADEPLPMPRVVTDRPLFVGYGLLFLTSESCQRDWKQIQIEAEHRGWELTHVVDASTADKQRDTLQTFINKGTNGHWRDILTADDLKLYEAAMARELTPDCAHWLQHGRLGDA